MTVISVSVDVISVLASLVEGGSCVVGASVEPDMSTTAEVVGFVDGAGDSVSVLAVDVSSEDIVVK